MRQAQRGAAAVAATGGLGLLLPQIVSQHPWQLGACGGFALLILGLFGLAES